MNGLEGQVARLQLGLPIDPNVFDAALAFIATGDDMVDFTLSSLMRILYQYPSRIPPELKSRMERAVLDFRYWFYPDEGDVHSRASTWTEYHQLLYHSLEYLAGQRYPTRQFSKTEKTGAWHMEHGKFMLLFWMSIRARAGFSEWLSPGYYGDDFVGLLNLVDFARDEHVAQLAARFCDLILLDIAIHSFDGGLRCSMGRPYSNMLKEPRTTTAAAMLMLATGEPDPEAPTVAAGGAVFQAVSKYKAPAIIAALARRPSQPELIHESTGWSPEEGIAWGLDPMRLSDILIFWGVGANLHPLVYRGTAHAASAWHIRSGDLPEIRRMDAELERLGDVSKIPDTEIHALFRVNLETYRTPDYVTGSAQDYRKGIGGYQQQSWMASLGGKASIWTNHPGADTENVRPNFWSGNGIMPRVAQHKNVVVAIYRIPENNPRPYSHAYFPVREFEEFRRVKGWLVGRRGEGYVALAASPALEPGQNETEWISYAPRSAWICVLGRKAEDDGFASFVNRVTSATLKFDGADLSYKESSGASTAFDWDSALQINGKPISITGYPRYDSPYLTARRGDLRFQISAAGLNYEIDLTGLKNVPLSQ